jgi:TrpR-related protein YerC/YecD
MKITPENKALYKAILSLKNVDEASRFFRDLLTPAEIEEFSKRWQVVKLLNEGLNYRNIAQQVKTSTATVTRVASWLNNGMGGYRLASDRLAHHQASASRQKPA